LRPSLDGSPGGLVALEKVNAAKAQVIYDAIDGSAGFTRDRRRQAARSLMNVTFRLPAKS